IRDGHVTGVQTCALPISDAWTMTPDEIRVWATRGRALGCMEALICLGDKPELAYPSYRTLLAELGHRTTAEYVLAACEIALACRSEERRVGKEGRARWAA